MVDTFVGLEPFWFGGLSALFSAGLLVSCSAWVAAPCALPLPFVPLPRVRFDALDPGGGDGVQGVRVLLLFWLCGLFFHGP